MFDTSKDLWVASELTTPLKRKGLKLQMSLQGGLGQGCFGVVDMLVLPVHITEYIVASLELSERPQRQKLWISM